MKTLLGMERVTAARIEELRQEGVEVRSEARPRGFPGLVAVFVKPEDQKHSVAKRIEAEVPEAERVITPTLTVNAEPDAIAQAAVEIAKASITREDTFAVRTTRRGTHPFTSIDLNVRVGSAVEEATKAAVDLESPDKIVWVEVLGPEALLSVVEGSRVWRKQKPGKHDVKEFLRRVSLVQVPYLGPPDASESMGARIGRAAQTFEVEELVVALTGGVEARPLAYFLKGLFAGLDSRYRVQQRSYAHKPQRVRVRVQDLYQLVRERRGEPMVVLEPEGETLPRVADRLSALFLEGGGRVNLLLGSREGVPKGVYRLVGLVVDLCPGVTLSTEYAASSALIAIAHILEEKLLQRNS